jgi:hypothetical protein
MMAYENKRAIFNVILKKYKDYLELYRAVNNGSIQGVTSFQDFYWHYTYYSKYANGRVNEGRSM